MYLNRRKSKVIFKIEITFTRKIRYIERNLEYVVKSVFSKG